MKAGKLETTQQCCSLYWTLPDHAQSFVFCSQISAE